MVRGSLKVHPFAFGARKDIKHSNFLITLNTNIRFAKDLNDNEINEFVNPLNDMVDAVLGNEENVKKYILFGKSGAGRGSFVVDNTIVWNDDIIKEYMINARAEVGKNKRGSRLHMHIALGIIHSSYIRFDKDLFLEEVNDYLKSIDYPYPICYINISTGNLTPQEYVIRQSYE